MGWRTYLVMYFGTRGAKISELVKKIEEVGFSSQLGPVDFVYDWGAEPPTKEQVFELGDRLTEILENTGTVFNLDTHD